MSQLLLSAPVIEKSRRHLQQECHKLSERGIVPHLSVILVGQHAPSLIYTRNKKNFCESLGAECEIIHLDAQISEVDFLQHVQKEIHNPLVHGCFVQLPLPAHLSHLDLGRLIPPEKDVDGFCPENLFDLLGGEITEKTLLPCTPRGIMDLLNYYGVSWNQKHTLMIGRSMIVGRPAALLALSQNSTVTIAHSHTPDLKPLIEQADIIISAIGRPKFLGANLFGKSKDKILIDVGINKDENGKLCGDFDFESLRDRCQAITPVPGGVGPMTILGLAKNLIHACKYQTKS